MKTKSKEEIDKAVLKTLNEIACKMICLQKKYGLRLTDAKVVSRDNNAELEITLLDTTDWKHPVRTVQGKKFTNKEVVCQN